MKSVKCIAAIVAFVVLTIDNVNGQTTYNYFTSEVYPGLYSQVTFYKGYILFNTSPGNNVRLNLSRNDGGILYYYNNESLIVAITANGSALSVTLNGKTTNFQYVGPVTQPRGNSSPYGGNSGSANSSRRIKCSFCNGTGKIVKNDHITQYGTNDYYIYKNCSECGCRYNSTLTNHYHATCSNCYGKGYIER